MTVRRERQEFVALALRLSAAVQAFAGRARGLFYAVMLLGHRCPRCSGSLHMTGESRCQCESCGHTLDPTVAFQPCLRCGGPVLLRVRRYQCRQCGEDVSSRFVFDGIPFDAAYFRAKMAESRQHRRRRHEDASLLAIENRSTVLVPPEWDLAAVPGLQDALDSLVGGAEVLAWLPVTRGFDLNRYQRHLEAHVGSEEQPFDDLPALDENRRLDRIWRFIAIIFMAHFGRIDILQREQTILVRRHETDGER